MLESLEPAEGDIKFSEEEVAHGLGFGTYPLEALRIAAFVYESCGILLTQTQVLDEFDPDWIFDLLRYLKMRSAKRKGSAAVGAASNGHSD